MRIYAIKIRELFLFWIEREREREREKEGTREGTKKRGHKRRGRD